MAAEARAMLDALMGGDRNAPIPKGAALSHRNKNKQRSSRHRGDKPMRLPGVRKRSCYDPNICPFYCAWGIDVFDLFVNTKSDIGANPRIVDDDAREEFLNLPPPDKDRLGFEFQLYRELQELVRQCDRTVNRNKEKLRQEIQRATKSGVDPIATVDEDGVKRVAELQLAMEKGENQLDELIAKLDELEDEEDEAESKENGEKKAKEIDADKLRQTHSIATQIQHKLIELQPVKEQLETSKRSLFFYRSDTSTDKTVCEVSGNFMSSRDADERIAAHYAGKQYVGWKMVREKLAELDKRFRGRSGPPPPPHGMRNGPPMNYPPQQQRKRSRSRERDNRMYRGPPPPNYHPPGYGRPGYDRGPPPPRGNDYYPPPNAPYGRQYDRRDRDYDRGRWR